MLIPQIEIRIYRVTDDSQVKQWVIRHVSEVKISGDSDTFSDTCRIELAKNIKWAQSEECPIRRDDKVEVYMGYNGKLAKRFSGWVSEVKAGVPTVITCMDDVFLLRSVTIKKKLYTNTSINKIIEEIVPATVRVKISGEIKISSWRTTAETVAGEIALMEESFPIKAFFELDDDGEPTLYVFTSWIDGRDNAGEFTERKNIISHNLEYRRSEDVKVRIKGVSHLLNGKTLTYIEGDGEEVTKNYYNLTMEELKAMVKQEIKREKWSGLNGSFETFGMPKVKKTDTVDMEIEGVKKARYVVKGVTVKFGQGGYRQEIELQRKVVEL